MRKSAGNMYGFVTHTWNPIKGRCSHGCAYCYMRRFPLGELRLDQKELAEDHGDDKNIFVGSSCDMFAENVPAEWIEAVLEECREYYGNKYFFQSKNPRRMAEFWKSLPLSVVLLTTIETNRVYPEMGRTPPPFDRALAMAELHYEGWKTMITIEPVMDFDLPEMLAMIRRCRPHQVNIGADSKGCRLPEPTAEKVRDLIEGLKGFTVVYEKPNLARLKEAKP